MSQTDYETNLGAAILGMFAAIKICRKNGIEPEQLLRIVERQTEEWGLLPPTPRPALSATDAGEPSR